MPCPKWHIYWVLVICVIECWSCAPLSQPFKFFSAERLDGYNPVTNFSADQAVLPVCPWIRALELIVGPMFIECWWCAPLSQPFKRSAFFLGFYVRTNWAEPYQLRYLRWSTCKHCMSSLLLLWVLCAPLSWFRANWLLFFLGFLSKISLKDQSHLRFLFSLGCSLCTPCTTNVQWGLASLMSVDQSILTSMIIVVA